MTISASNELRVPIQNVGRAESLSQEAAVQRHIRVTTRQEEYLGIKHTKVHGSFIMTNV